MRALLLLLAAIAPRGAAQQPPQPPEPVLDVVLPADSLRARLAPAVVSTRMLEDRTTRELLHSGFPARLKYRLEVWEASWPFDSRLRSVEWDVLVQYDPLAKHYSVYRLTERMTTPLGTFADLHDAQEVTARPYVPDIVPPIERKKRYYYFVSLEVESLSVTDISEVQRWLKGEATPAIQGKQNAGTALGRGFQTLFTRLLGGQVRTYHSHSSIFRP